MAQGSKPAVTVRTLTEEEVREYLEGKATKAARKVKGTARREAVKELRKKYKTEYDNLIKSFGGTVGK